MKKILLLLLLSTVGLFSAQAQVQNFNVGDVCPDFSVTDVNGVTHKLYDITASGQYVIIDFFFTTCGPCQQMAPIFSELHEKYGCNGGKLFCISIDTGYDDADVVAFENNYGGPSAHAPAVSGNQGGGNAVINTMNVQAFPTFAMIGPDNKIISTDIWPISNVASFESEFPANSGITPMACSAVNVDPSSEQMPLSIYPNPTSQRAQLSMDFNSMEPAVVEVFDLAGQKDMEQG